MWPKKEKFTNDSDTLEEERMINPQAHSIMYHGLPAMEVVAPVWSRAESSSAEDFLLSGDKGSNMNKRLGMVRLALPLDQVLQREYRLLRRIVTIVFISGGIGIALIFFFMHRILRPIQLLSLGTSHIVRGEYGVSVPILSKDELGDLAVDFNHMSKVLAATTVSKDYLGEISCPT